MKICFVQPDTTYQIEKNRHALALTFPQIILDLELQYSDYCVYVMGKSNIDFLPFIEKENPTHVFITAITSTFPFAMQLAKVAKSKGCIVVLGGLFSSINALKIAKHFDMFDYVMQGYSHKSVLERIVYPQNKPVIISNMKPSNYNISIADIITDKRFRDIYNPSDTVCYELANGCFYNCSFCTMRAAFPKQGIKRRPIDIGKGDIKKLSKFWRKLKLIDDDISISLECVKELDFTDFEEVIAEIRIDRINEGTMQILKKAGVTHLIVGVESFDVEFLRLSSKTRRPNSWKEQIEMAISLFKKYDMVMRPVVMITNEFTTMESLVALKDKIKDWTPENHIELLCSFYTPHPGMGNATLYSRLLTYNLKYFDHLHCVWLPPRIKNDEREAIQEVYKDITILTDSEEYNPPMSFDFLEEEDYSVFFND